MPRSDDGISRSDWFGVTYREDKPRVVESIARLVSRGDYPAKHGGKVPAELVG